jgi:hypothetical protein
LDLGEWLKAFRSMHARFKAGELSPTELATYRLGRDELARALLAAQQVAMKKSEVPRRQIRVARALQLDLDLGKDRIRGMTLDLSAGGFGALLAKPPTPGDAVRFTLRLPGQESVSGAARVVDAKVLPGNVRAAFSFMSLSPQDAERVETFVFDALLEHIG